MTTFLMISLVQQLVDGSPLMTVGEFVVLIAVKLGYTEELAKWLEVEFSDVVAEDRTQTLDVARDEGGGGVQAARGGGDRGEAPGGDHQGTAGDLPQGGVHH